MISEQIREKFLKFFEKRGHKVLPSASLVPENDPSVLFTTAGMQPLVPYLLGEKHPAGTRLVNIQKCVRTGDIDEIGDNTHLTFFEMMGNWSLGDYFKEDAIRWSFELLTSKEEGFGLDPRRLYVTCFEGNADAPRDEESGEIWRKIFEEHNIEGERIYFMPAENNWWQPGPNGPCGPDTEMFYDLTGALTEGMTKDQYLKADQEQKVVEIWNNVFMQYLKKDDKVVGELPNKNVDTGSGLERVTTVLQGKTNVFETDLFTHAIAEIQKLSKLPGNIKSERIIVDHIRAATFMIADGVLPSNTDRGYILRRLIRRAVRHANILMMQGKVFEIVKIFQEKYKDIYPDLSSEENLLRIPSVINLEEIKFDETLSKGLKEFEKGLVDPFILFTTYGFPFELTQELALEKGIEIDQEKFKKDLEAHQELSRAGAEQKFKGGLGDTSEMSVKYHTATHLLHQALREVLGAHVEQKGSNITPERLRFDFSHPQKMTPEEKKRVEEIVNEKIKADLPVNKVVMKKEEAEKIGALHFFGDKYGDEVSVYFIGPSLEEAYSKEFCGGPHVSRTGDLARGTDPEAKLRGNSESQSKGPFKIVKEEAVAQGIRRIKATLT